MTRDYSILAGETIELRKTNWKTPAFIYVALVFGVAFPVMYLLVPGMKNIPLAAVIIIAVFTLINLRVWGLLTTVTIGQEGIVFRSPIKTRTFRWNEIQTTGMYIVSRNRKEPIPPQRYHEKFYLRLKYVWLSKYPHAEPGMFRFNSDVYADFEYNEEAWALMEKYRAANKPDAPHGVTSGTIAGQQPF
jgi:hypothetical protein